MAKKKGISEPNSLAGTHETSADEPSTCEPTERDKETQPNWQIQLRDVESIVPYAKNPRVHSKAQIWQIAKSIDRFGLVGAIVIRGGVIAKGHGTFAAIQKLLLDGIRIYAAPGRSAGGEPYPQGKVPVIDASKWTESQFRAFVIADNKLAANSGWDSELLKLELDAVLADGFDAQTLGFANDELLALAEAVPTEFNLAGGLPEVIDQDVRAQRSIVVHFLKIEDVDAFARLLNQKIGPKIRSVWYPQQPRNDTSIKRYAEA